LYAEKLGLIPTQSVTKKNCDVLVAQDKASMSGKAKKARDFGIPVISVDDFFQVFHTKKIK
jgi:DNA polymerase-3 subunit epsilon